MLQQELFGAPQFRHVSLLCGHSPETSELPEQLGTLGVLLPA